MPGSDGHQTAAGHYPATRHSVIGALDAADETARRQAWDTLIAAYWKPVYKHLRLSWTLPRQDAEDLTQEFFARALEGGMLERFDAGRARFRTYLRVCLDRFASNARKAEGRLKRGGAAAHLPLDFPGAERELGLAAPGDADEVFRQEMIRALFGAAVDTLRERCRRAGKDVQFAVFERYDLRTYPGTGDRPTYAQLATELGIPATQVTNYLAAMRRAFRVLVLEQLRAITATEAEFRAEAGELFGHEPG